LKWFLLCLFLLHTLILISLAQNYIDSAKVDIGILTSPEFQGRGFTHGGHLKASDYIKNQFIHIGLVPVEEKYYQTFDFKVNLFKSAPVLRINDVVLKLGEDFLPDATSGSGNGDDETNIFFVGSGLYILDKKINNYSKVNQRGAILLMDNEIPEKIKKDKSIDRQFYSQAMRIELAKQIEASAVIFLVDKLSFSTPYRRNDIPIFDVLKSSLPNNIEKISFDVETSFDEIESRNVIGMIPGQLKSDSILILCAHYDHLSAFPDSTYFPGANDNASGVGMVLSLARYFRKNPLNINLAVIAFSGEDAGLHGSKYFSENPVFDLSDVKFLINFDMVASAEEGVVAVGGVDNPDYFKVLSAVNDVLNLGILGKRKNAPNGDHYFLTQKGVKAFYLYTNKGKQPYHSVFDKYDTLEWDDFSNTFELSREFIKQIDIN
jgi:aminopeptidase YwaD